MIEERVVEVFQKINGILDTQPIDEIGIIVGAPEPIVQVECKLGIAHTMVKPLYKCAIEKLCALDALISNSSLLLLENWRAVQNSSRLLLLIKGDFPLAFKLRKQMIELDILTIASEITLLTLIFGRTPKTPSGWYHRRWCLQRNTNLKGRDRLTATEIESEREICRKIAEASPKNYYCWMHRLWLLDHMTHGQLIDELTFTHDWLISHVSDHSACSHRIHVIYLIVSKLTNYDDSDTLFTQLEINTALSCNASLERIFLFLFDCLDISSTLINKRPGHEALWYHRRSLLVLILQLVMILFKIEWSEMCSRLHTTVLDENLTTEQYSSLNPMGDWFSNKKVTDNKIILWSVFGHIGNTENIILTSSYLSNWLYNFLKSEIRFCHDCINIKSDWDFEAQKTMALRYSAFTLDMVLIYVSVSHQVIDLKILQVAKNIKHSYHEFMNDNDNVNIDNNYEKDLIRVCRNSLQEVKLHLVNSFAIFRL